MYEWLYFRTNGGQGHKTHKVTDNTIHTQRL